MQGLEGVSVSTLPVSLISLELNSKPFTDDYSNPLIIFPSPQSIHYFSHEHFWSWIFPLAYWTSEGWKRAWLLPAISLLRFRGLWINYVHEVESTQTSHHSSLGGFQNFSSVNPRSFQITLAPGPCSYCSEWTRSGWNFRPSLLSLSCPRLSPCVLERCEFNFSTLGTTGPVCNKDLLNKGMKVLNYISTPYCKSESML